MQLETRWKEIMNIINKKGKVTVNQLKDLLYVSEATIRRDLSKMDQLGLIERVYGGAIAPQTSNREISIYLRSQRAIREKRKIAEATLQFIKPNMTLFADSSSTVGYVLKLLTDLSGISVITNGLNNALIIAENTTADIYLLGGKVRSKSNSIHGGRAMQDIQNFQADIILFSCSGISETGRISEASADQAWIKHEMLINAKKRILLIDHFKFNQDYMSKICNYNEVDIIITDQRPNDNIVNVIKKHGISLVVSL